MCAVGRNSLFVNARVHLPGSKGRTAVTTSTVNYIATRIGADMSATPSDLRRAELAKRMALAGYYAERPGSTALFDQDGAVPLCKARSQLAAAEGAVATWVISVRRREADELRLGCKEEWQRWCRRELTPALAVAMGVPESSVRWIAAEHENAVNSKHVHIISWSSDGSFLSVMPKPRLEHACSMLTNAALTPAIEAALCERDIARSLAVDAVSAVPAEDVRVALPPTGRISYAHLRRWHPEIAENVCKELTYAAERHLAIKSSEARYRLAVEHCADLKGLEGSERERYVSNAMQELTARKANALLRTIAPNRTEAPEKTPVHTPVPQDGPAARRLRKKRVKCEVAACVSRREMAKVTDAVRKQRPIPTSVLRRCPTFLYAAQHAPATAVRAVLSNTERAISTSRQEDPSEEALRILAKATIAILRIANFTGREGTRISKQIIKEVSI